MATMGVKGLSHNNKRLPNIYLKLFCYGVKGAINVTVCRNKKKNNFIINNL